MKRTVFTITAIFVALFLTACHDEEEENFVQTGKMIVIEPFKGCQFNMVFVEGGSFYMGSQSLDTAALNYDPEAHADEAPVHKVTLDGYYIATTEVTQALWLYVTGTTQYFYNEWGPNYPAYNVHWNDCRKFIKELNRYTGLKFRLPTEAEWEYAARGGKYSRGYRYSGSDYIDEVGWCWQNSRNMVHEVAQKRPNELGIYDMSGNVREWCNDWADVYTEDDQINPQGPVGGNFRMVRGGSRYNAPRACRSTYRWCYYDYTSDNLTGLRLVMDTVGLDTVHSRFIKSL